MCNNNNSNDDNHNNFFVVIKVWINPKCTNCTSFAPIPFQFPAECNFEAP